MPKLDGILETALYTDDMARAQAFYEDVLGLQPIFSDSRLRAYGVASRSVLLIFRRGSSDEPRRQRRRDALDHGCPVARHALANEPHRAVPWLRLLIAPTPMRYPVDHRPVR